MGKIGINSIVAAAQPFDENSPKYFCCFRKLHIKTAARIVAMALVFGIFANIFYSFGRSPTVIVYSWVLASFSVGVYGSLLYAVFKEKRIFTMPFLVFQGIFILLTGIIFFAFMMCAMFSNKTLLTLALDLGGADPTDDIYSLGASVRSFVVIVMIFWVFFICVQCWFFEIIHRFYQYLEDRETSFTFNLEPEFRVSSA